MQLLAFKYKLWGTYALGETNLTDILDATKWLIALMSHLHVA